MEINVNFQQFQNIVDEFRPHPVILYSDGVSTGTGDGNHVEDRTIVLSDRVGALSFSWIVHPSIAEFLAVYPDAIFVTAAV